jgi:ketosteroid isomerase-like protein
MTDIVTATDAVAIERVLMRYAWAIDTKDWDAFRSVFTDDCSLTYGVEWGPPLTGLDELASFVIHIHSPLDGSLHNTTNILVTSADDQAVGVSSAVDAFLVRRGAPDGDTLRVIGTYDDQLVRTGAGFLIHRRSFRTLWSEGNPLVVGQGWARPA